MRTRDLFPTDLDEVRCLNEEFFPIKYTEDFYNRIDFQTIQGKVALYDNLIVGCLIYRNQPSFFSKSHYIMTLGVVHEMRSLGLGRRLVSLLNHHTELHVVDYNAKAIHFYLREGFHVQEQIKDYYEICGKIYDALHLVRPSQKSFWNYFF